MAIFFSYLISLPVHLPLLHPSPSPLGMAPTDSGAGAAKTRPQRNPWGQEKSARDKFAGVFLHPHPHPPGFGRVSGACGFGKIYYKNRQLHNLNRQIADFS